MNQQPIGVIDSGIGGLSILQTLKLELPLENFIYIADQQFFPYGNLSKVQINRRITQLMAFLNSRSVKAVVIACNTITVASIKLLRKLYPYLPIIGTEPAIKMAIDKHLKENIIVLSTLSTSKSKSFKELIAKLDQKGQVIIHPCQDLVEVIETADTAKLNQALSKHLANLNSNYSAIVLGCTHFILVQEAIQQKLKNHILIIEPSQAIATHTRKVLKESKILSNIHIPFRNGMTQYLTTGNPKRASVSATKLLKQSIIFTKCSI